MESRQEALDLPTGDVVIGWCPHCAFATNMIFDVGMNAYSTKYEEVQTFSPTFNSFQSELVERLIEKHGIQGKNVVEIGCGKGEFLLELCDRGDNSGVGVDPSFLAGRGGWNAAGRCRFINELYSAERHGELPADAIVCRHTLEHIHPTREFIQTIRRAIGDDLDTLVFMEIPDQERVYDERAFWDIYYEHCSYFTQGALDRLFLDCGFEILNSRKGFGDQYLLIEARPLPVGQRPAFQVQEKVDEIRRKVEGFSEDAPRIIRGWMDRFDQWKTQAKRVVIWGAGSKGVAFLTTLGVDYGLTYAVDINPHKQGFFMPGTGHEVVLPTFLRENCPDVVVVMNEIYEDEIRRELAEMGLAPELVSV
jgi:SAM-dependent methyltransferase